ncbi:hypothetical protein QAD02_016428 [Eretmocerus hayati]|uniref:Uncharacterized protein n=1 Tax=Eretmocerus hayati TaxID=131215 RepID=A0ACC2PCA6_9HYME|nr:hypothetical protein QAD02_016428 [Eretmocerus hayati]
MSRIEQAFVLSVTICLALPELGSEALKGFDDKKSAKNEIIFMRPYSDQDEIATLPVTEGIENTTVWIVHCYNTIIAPKTRCTLQVQDYDSDRTSEMQKCNFLVTNSFKGSISILPWIRAFRMRKDKFLLAEIEHIFNKTMGVNRTNDEDLRIDTFVRFNVIDMESCVARKIETRIVGSTYNTTQLDYSGFLKHLDIRISKNTFDVFYPDFENFKYVQERFTIDGWRVKGPVSAKDFELDEQAVKVNMYYNHSITNIRSWERFNVGDVCGNNIPCHLLLETEESDAMTTSRKTHTSCKKFNAKTWHCQSESLLNSGAISEWNMVFDYEPKHIMIYNVWIDRVVVMTSKKVLDYLIINLTILGLDGMLYEPVEFAKIGRSVSIMHGHFFINRDFDICFSLLFVTQNYEQYHNFVSKCYSKENLTMKS